MKLVGFGFNLAPDVTAAVAADGRRCRRVFNGTPLLAPAEEALKDTIMVEAIYRSATSGRKASGEAARPLALMERNLVPVDRHQDRHRS